MSYASLTPKSEEDKKRRKEKMQSLAKEVKQELTGRIVPFWEGLRDEEYGGFYGYQDFDHERAENV